MQATDLGVSAHQVSAAFEFPFPRTRFGHIFDNHPDVGMKLAQNGRVLLMLVDRNYLAEVLLLQSRYQILTHEPGSAGYNNFSR